MNELLTIQDLANLLAAKHRVTNKNAEAFIKEFFLLIEETLKTEHSLKINGLGTFERVDIDNKEGINVNTDERFSIEGHATITFNPDANLRDIINKPFAHFETVVLNESTVLIDTPMEKVETEDDKSHSATVIELQSKVVEEKAFGCIPENMVTQEPEKAIEKIDCPTLTVEPTKTVVEKEKSSITFLLTIIIAVIVLCGAAVLFIYYPDLLPSSSKEPLTAIETTQPTQPIQPVRPIQNETQLPDATKKVAISTYSDSVKYAITGTKIAHTIKKGESLMKVSLKYYGTKTLWQYIVKHNEKVIKNPDNVPYGTVIKIPELTKSE